MLTRAGLVELFETLKEQDVLSVYVDADERDPAHRDVWKLRLDGEIARARRRLADEDGADLGPFDAAWSLVEDRLHRDDDTLPRKRGWVAFATPDRLWYADAVPSSMPDLVRWQQGVHAAPYIRALKQERPVTVVIVDSRRARLFEQAEGDIRESEGTLADTFLGDLTDTGMRKASSRASGMRGETSTDQAHRLLEMAGERMRKALVERIQDAAGDDGLVVVGGPQESVARLLAVLPRPLQGRATAWSRLHLDMSAAEVREEIRAAAGELSEGEHRILTTEVVDAARAGGKGTLGKDDTLQALHALSVDTLLLSRTFVRDHPGVADLAVGLAFTQNADVVEASGEAGAELDREAHGMAARLRYVAPRGGGD